MAALTRRASARSATISAEAAIAVLLKTPLARSYTATLQHTRLGAVAYGRICPVHVWPVLRCPPRGSRQVGRKFWASTSRARFISASLSCSTASAGRLCWAISRCDRCRRVLHGGEED